MVVEGRSLIPWLHSWLHFEQTFAPPGEPGGAIRDQMDGRGDWIRTSDLLNPIQVRYQAALRPDDFVLRMST